MHNLKKVVAVIAVLAMVLGTMVTGFAATVTPAKVGSDVAGTDYETAATELAALGIMTGYPDGTFKPGNQITRAEFATLVVRALGLESAAKLTTAKPAFSDVNADYQWAWGYITVATENGIIKGYPDGTFGPAKPVTYAEAVAMLVRALGYEPAVTGTWPVGYLSKGSELGITDDVKVSADGYANRGDVAVMLDNALDIDMMEQTGYGTDISYEVKEGKTLLSDKLKVDEYEDYVVTATPKVDSSLDDDEIKMVDENGKNEDTYTVAAGINPDDLLGLKVTAWEKDDKIVYVKYDTAQVKTDVVGEDATEDSVYLYVADDTYDFAKDAVVYINNDSADPEDLKTGMYGRFIFEDGDVRFADVYELTQTNMVVTAVNKDDKTIDYIDSDGSKSTLDLTNADEGYKIFLDGKTIDLSDVKADDVISYADIDGDWYYLFVTRNAVEGKLTKTKSTTLYVDDKGYATSAGNLNGVTVYTMNDGKDYYSYAGNDAAVFDDAIGENVKILLDNVGEVAFLTTDVKVTSDDNYGILTAADTFSDKVKIFANGEKTTYDFDGDVYTGYTTDWQKDDLSAFGDRNGDAYLVMFRTDKDNVVTEIYILGDVVYRPGTTPVVSTFTENTGVTGKLNLHVVTGDVLDSFDKDDDTINAGSIYYVDDTTSIVDTIDDPDVVAWDDIKDSINGSTLNSNIGVVLIADSKDRVKFMAFTSNDEFSKVQSTAEYGVITDRYYDGDYKVDIDKYDGGKVTYKVGNVAGLGLTKASELNKGMLVKFTISNDKANITVLYNARKIDNGNIYDATNNVLGAVNVSGKVDSKDGSYITVGSKTYKFDSKSVVYEVKLDDNKDYDTISASSYSKILAGYDVFGAVENNVIKALFYVKGEKPAPAPESPQIADLKVSDAYGDHAVGSDGKVEINVYGQNLSTATFTVKVKATDNKDAVGVLTVKVNDKTATYNSTSGYYEYTYTVDLSGLTFPLDLPKVTVEVTDSDTNNTTKDIYIHVINVKPLPSL